MYFETYGPLYFEIGSEHFWKNNFWNKVEELDEGLSSAIGCYSFCLNNGKSKKPWYVGKTIAANGFRDEVFQPHKISHYEQVMSDRRGKSFLMLFPLMSEGWSFSRNISEGESTIAWLENTLIGMALAKNPELRNSSQTRFLREVWVNGLIGGQTQGRPSRDASKAKEVVL